MSRTAEEDSIYRQEHRERIHELQRIRRLKNTSTPSRVLKNALGAGHPKSAED